MPASYTRPRLAVYASPKCCEDPNLRLYKAYFNVAWFVRAYQHLLFRDYDVYTTDETKRAILEVKATVDEDLAMWGLGAAFSRQWQVPTRVSDPGKLESLGSGFDAQVELAGCVARREFERLLMFQDPDDVHSHLPEAHALIRNCTLADVGLNINAGATFWAEGRWAADLRTARARRLNANGFGSWWTSRRQTAGFHRLLNPARQTIAFIAHDQEKATMSRLVYHYSHELASPDFRLTGTSGTCQHANEYLAERAAPWEVPLLRPAAAAPGASHGPTGGDVVIASEIVRTWACN